jgi:hypothetical protein
MRLLTILRSPRAILAMIGLGFALSSPALAQPANNLCANAILVTDGTVAGTTVGATNDGTGSCGASGSSPDVWYRYVAPVDGMLTASTCDGATWDTVLSIWNGCPGSGSEISCVDDSCAFQTVVTASIDEGETYYIRVAGFSGATGAFTLTVASDTGPPGGSKGPDVVYSDISGVAQYGPVGGVYAYAWGTSTCNIGDENLRWGNSWGGSPSVGFNAYRLHDGRLLQIGMSWVKRACCAAAGSGCGMACNGVGGSMLGIGCRDVYSAGYNGSFGNLAKRSSLNPFTGAHSLVGGSGDAIFGRLQIPASDMSSAQYPGAQYFAEGVYVGSDDAPAGNAANNASYKRLITGPNGALSVNGLTTIGLGAIYAWRSHGLGVGMPDKSVFVTPLDIPDEGHLVVAHKVTDLGKGTWRYDYAVFNINSDRAGGSVTVPIPAGTTVTNVGFHDVPYHSGEPYDNTDWVSNVSATAVTWSSPQTFAQNPNSNALRWGTMYNFWFDADRAPANGQVTLGLFKPHTPQSVDFAASVPGIDCIADVDGNNMVDADDLTAVILEWGACPAPPAACPADVNNSGAVDADDLVAVVLAWGPC